MSPGTEYGLDSIKQSSKVVRKRKFSQIETDEIEDPANTPKLEALDEEWKPKRAKQGWRKEDDEIYHLRISL